MFNTDHFQRVLDELRGDMSLPTFSRAAGIGPTALENNIRFGTSPKASNLRKLCTHYDVTADYVLDNPYAGKYRSEGDTFADKLRACYHAKKVSQIQAAVDTGIAEATLVHYSHNRTEPSARNLSILCEYFGVSADWLLGIEKEV